MADNKDGNTEEAVDKDNLEEKGEVSEGDEGNKDKEGATKEGEVNKERRDEGHKVGGTKASSASMLEFSGDYEEEEGEEEETEEQIELRERRRKEKEEEEENARLMEKRRREELKRKVGEGWFVDKGKRKKRDSVRRSLKDLSSRVSMRRSETEHIEGMITQKIPVPKDELHSIIEPEMDYKARSSDVRRMEEGPYGKIVPESPESARGSVLELPVQKIIPSDEVEETQSVLQEAMSRLMFGAIEERLLRGDVHRLKHPDRPQTDLEKLLGLKPTEFSDEELGEGEEEEYRYDRGDMSVEDFILTERALLQQEAYREGHHPDKPIRQRRPRKLSEVLHEIEDDFQKLYSAQEEWGFGGEEEEEEMEMEYERELEGEGDSQREYRRMMLRAQGQAVVAMLERFKGQCFGRNLGDILGIESIRKYKAGFEDIGDEGLSKSDMDFLIATLRQKLIEEKEYNERMLEIMRQRRSRAKRMFDLEKIYGLQRRSLRLYREDGDDDLQMLWDYIDSRMVDIWKTERYM